MSCFWISKRNETAAALWLILTDWLLWLRRGGVLLWLEGGGCSVALCAPCTGKSPLPRLRSCSGQRTDKVKRCYSCPTVPARWRQTNKQANKQKTRWKDVTLVLAQRIKTNKQAKKQKNKVKTRHSCSNTMNTKKQTNKQTVHRQGEKISQLSQHSEDKQTKSVKTCCSCPSTTLSNPSKLCVYKCNHFSIKKITKHKRMKCQGIVTGYHQELLQLPWPTTGQVNQLCEFLLIQTPQCHNSCSTLLQHNQCN